MKSCYPIIYIEKVGFLTMITTDYTRTLKFTLDDRPKPLNIIRGHYHSVSLPIVGLPWFCCTLIRPAADQLLIFMCCCCCCCCRMCFCSARCVSMILVACIMFVYYLGRLYKLTCIYKQIQQDNHQITTKQSPNNNNN